MESLRPSIEWELFLLPYFPFISVTTTQPRQCTARTEVASKRLALEICWAQALRHRTLHTGLGLLDCQRNSVIALLATHGRKQLPPEYLIL